mmetsp:Transcript_15002/g.31811  ORF Transcript_15002/g.31811 Transcript_15002/m.31811 type:complete len:233 (+) Transcript_15002:275-973(+)
MMMDRSTTLETVRILPLRTTNAIDVGFGKPPRMTFATATPRRRRMQRPSRRRRRRRRRGRRVRRKVLRGIVLRGAATVPQFLLRCARVYNELRWKPGSIRTLFFAAAAPAARGSSLPPLVLLLQLRLLLQLQLRLLHPPLLVLLESMPLLFLLHEHPRPSPRIQPTLFVLHMQRFFDASQAFQFGAAASLVVFAALSAEVVLSSFSLFVGGVGGARRGRRRRRSGRMGMRRG